MKGEGEKTLVVCGVECEAEIRKMLARDLRAETFMIIGSVPPIDDLAARQRRGLMPALSLG